MESYIYDNGALRTNRSTRFTRRREAVPHTDMRPSARCSLPAPAPGVNGAIHRPRARAPPLDPAQPLQGRGASLEAACPDTSQSALPHAPRSHRSLRAVEDDDRLDHFGEDMFTK